MSPPMPNPTLTPTITALARELAERVRELPSCTCKACVGVTIRAGELLSALASPPVEAAQGEWISVAERLPTRGEEVLIRGWGEGRKHYVFELGTYEVEPCRKQWLGDDNALLWFEPVDWMPLPRPLVPPAAPEARR